MSDFTEHEFIQFVRKICTADFPTEHAHDKAILDFEVISEHPAGSDLIYFSEAGKESPEAIVAEVKAWRLTAEKTGFKPE
ncbi:bacteriocin immunity protein [Pseudomonas sp. xss_2]|uniref:bacteriocin immunity protein n=1 Tax=Pseudomonas sp. xss_2 TaxID=3367215 RepID=UPI00370BB9EA